ncbi:Zn-ribbon domain-containing OB-fold protein [Cupriavidus sp. 2TAF22]|uniref:Zn-ribbon domain-containing OB-fold protein n=1 Tax=unclassified Cupriavidus TaxID=2640874 RepID=UPI003F91A953
MTTPYTHALFKAPAELPDNAEFWQAARAHRLLVRHCKSCGKPHWYPRTLCPFCMGDTQWKQASGRGTIYAFSVTRRAGPTPFCIAYVTLEEGVSMMTNIIDCDLDTVHIGQAVQVRFAPSEDGAPVPAFAPA